MDSDSIKYKVYQDPITKNVKLQIYRPYGIDNEWMMVDSFNDMTVKELQSLLEYLVYIFNKAKKDN